MRDAFALALLLCACRRPVGVADAGAQVVVAAVEPPADAGAALSAAEVEAYLQYQRAVLAGGDGGVGARAQADAAARAQAGLSVEQIEQIESIVSAIVARRMVTKITSTDVPLPELQKLSAGLSPEQKSAAQAALAGLKKSNEAAKALTVERERFGNQAVELVLAREAELTRNYERMTQ